MGTIKKGTIRSTRKKIWGIGTFDYDGLYTDENIKVCNHVWRDMLKRTTAKYQAEHKGYIGTKVCNEWLSFNNFKKWFDNNYIAGWYLDKDVLSHGEKVYSPDTCCFLPVELSGTIVSRKHQNSDLPRGVYQLPSGRYGTRESNKHLGVFNTPQEAYVVYKQEKEKHVHELAEKYYNQGLLKEHVYTALQKWELND